MSRVIRQILPLLLAGTAFAAVPVHGQKLSKEQQRFFALTPADFQRSITLKDDALDTTARISTEQGYQEKRGLLKLVSYDSFLRAFIDKKTGVTTFQLYDWLSYSGNWRFYESANYETPTGPESKLLTVIDRSVDSCSRYGCLFTEHLGLELPEDLLRQIAAGYNATNPKIWRFKLNSKAGVEWQDAIHSAEFVAMLTAVDQYRAAHHLATPQPASNFEDVVPTAVANDGAPATVAPQPAPKRRAKRPAVVCITCQ
jgi:hypothetical protein